MLSPPEIVVLVLKNVVSQHTEFPSLGEFLVEKYGFKTIEEEAREVSELEEKIPIDRREILFEEERGLPSFRRRSKGNTPL